ncbi:hypothetical protein GAY29_07895, partial [Azospirillum brasilense]|nr:hypothetical protein [Azospirillum brasilense]
MGANESRSHYTGRKSAAKKFEPPMFTALHTRSIAAMAAAGTFLSSGVGWAQGTPAANGAAPAAPPPMAAPMAAPAT